MELNEPDIVVVIRAPPAASVVAIVGCEMPVASKISDPMERVKERNRVKMIAQTTRLGMSRAS